MPTKRPPQDRNISANSSSASGRCSSSGAKFPRSTTSTSEPSPTKSESNDGGRQRLVAEHHLHSVHSHPLGLPLLYAFHDMDTNDMEYLPQNGSSRQSALVAKTLDGILETMKSTPELSIPTLILKLSLLIQDAFSDGKLLSYSTFNELEPDQTTRIVLASLEPNNNDVNAISAVPLAIIQLGMSCNDWWQVFHQSTNDLTRMLKDGHLKFNKPILLTTVTIDVNKTKNSVVEKFRIGVFLCVPKNKDNPEDLFQISLLWNTEVDSLDAASKAFGKFLCVTNDFASWRNNDCLSKGYKYFSSNCCKVKDRNGNDMVRTCLTIFWSGVNAVVLSFLDPFFRFYGAMIIEFARLIAPLRSTLVEKLEKLKWYLGPMTVSKMLQMI
jgi:hypothetical protein